MLNNKKIAILENYLKHLKYEKNYSTDTIDSYHSDILEYLTYLEEENKDYLTIKYQDIKYYLIQLAI